MRRVPLVLAAVAALASPAAAAPPNVAAWTGSATVAQCDMWVCLTATSDTCVAAGLDGAPVACSVTLEGRWLSACSGVGQGTLTLTDAYGDTHWTSATLVATDAGIAYVARYAFLFDRTALVATGTVAGCDGGAFNGAFGGRGL